MIEWIGPLVRRPVVHSVEFVRGDDDPLLGRDSVLGMRPWLLLGHATHRCKKPAGRSRGRAGTFVFTDIVDSTRLAEAIGDDAWARVMRWHDGIVRSVVAQHGGEEIKATGDGFFLAFADAGAALDAAVAIQRRLAEQGEQHGFAPSVRIGLHTAHASRSGLDYIGLGVNYAARIGASAAPAEILASDTTLDGLNRSIRAGGHRTLSLKGITEPVAVTSVEWR